MDKDDDRNGAPRRRFLGLLATGAALAGLAGCVEAPPYQPALPPAPGDDGPRSRPQLEQLLAPIALYPDALLAQVLMAATYPLEIVQAQRWLAAGGNAQLQGAALEQALDGQGWDISVKSLVPFPEVLRRLNDNLEWTQQVGDAVLAQQQEVLAAIQVLRQRAQAGGTLRSGAEQTVGGSPGAITIEPAQTQIVYVPTYDPTVVYGAWPYPAYPPYAWPYGYGYGGVALAAGIGFAAGVAIAGGYWGWANPGWGGGDININTDRIRNVDRDRIRQDGGRWQHDARHRQGVGYRDHASRDRYQGNRGRDAGSREQFRGRAQQLPAGGGFQGRAQQQPAGGRAGGLDGIGRGGDVRAASDRGAASRGGSFGGGGYGGARGGYGGGGYGGGRGGGGFGGGGGGFRGGGGRGGRR